MTTVVWVMGSLCLLQHLTNGQSTPISPEDEECNNKWSEFRANLTSVSFWFDKDCVKYAQDLVATCYLNPDAAEQFVHLITDNLEYGSVMQDFRTNHKQAYKLLHAAEAYYQTE